MLSRPGSQFSRFLSGAQSRSSGGHDPMSRSGLQVKASMRSIHPAGRAVWFIENHFDKDLTLDDIAEVAGVSRFHLTRVFDARLGLTVMAYVRGRRLTVAARRLAEGAPDILSVALEAGYGSHEAFTRAFRDRFDMTPEQAREGKSFDISTLQEPFIMDLHPIDTLSPHQIRTGRPLRIAGLSQHYTMDQTAAIPSQWQKLLPWLGNIDGQTGESNTTYGVCYNNSDDGLDYLSGVEVTPDAILPAEFVTLDIAAQTYAVFPHTGHISGLRSTWGAVWDKWIPESGLTVLHAPFFEKYGPSFDGRTGEGGLELWIPIKA
jgi:AraC family transcriptional regulator